MNSDIQKLIHEETAKSLSAFYKIPYNQALSTLSSGNDNAGDTINPNDFSAIADHTIRGLHLLTRQNYVTTGDIIYLLQKRANII